MKKNEELKKKAASLANNYEMTYGGCAQAVLAAMCDCLDGIGDDVYKCATAMNGGVAQTGNVCGAFSGGVLTIGALAGRERSNMQDPEGKKPNAVRIARRFHEKFVETYGGATCRDIQTKIFGRAFDMFDTAEFEAFLEAGGHDADKCPDVCGVASGWLIEILTDEGII